MVADKSSTGSLFLANSRLYQGENLTKYQEKFLKRYKEIEDMISITDKIKKYIKENKKTLLQ